MKNLFLGLSKEHQGELLLFFGVLFWGVFPLFLVLITQNVPAIFAAGLSTFMAFVFMGIICAFFHGFKWLKRKDIWFDVLMVVLFIGIGVYGLLFTASKFTDANNIALLGLTEVLVSFLVLSLVKAETYTKSAYLGGALVILGGFFVTYKTGFKFNIGDILVVLAYACAPFGNIYQRKLKRKISALQMMFLRSFFASIILLSISFILESGQLSSLNFNTLLLISIMGILFMGLQKIIWIEVIHRISIAKANAIGVIEPVITMFFVYLLWSTPPSNQQIIGLIPLVLGVLIILKSKNSFRINPSV